MIQKQLARQSDFSAGELVPDAKRRDAEAVVRAGARQMADVRLMASGAFEQRPGRRVVFVENGRVDEVRMSATTTYKLSFGVNTFKIRNSSDTVVFNESSKPWDASTNHQVRWAKIGNDIVICFPGMKPRIARWDGATTWTALDFAEAVSAGGQKKTPFYRMSPRDVTMLPSATTGTINLTFSAGMNLVAGHVGTRMRFCGRQIQIATVTGATTGTATVIEPLPKGQVLTFTVDPATVWNLGDVLRGALSGANGIVCAIDSGLKKVTVQLTSAALVQSSQTPGQGDPNAIGGFASGESVGGLGGSLLISTGVGSVTDTTPQAVLLWEDEVMNTLRGWPKSVSAVQGRLVFCDFPQIPEGIAVSALAAPDDFLPGAAPGDAMFEPAPRGARVMNVIEGGDLFVMTDIGIFYVPISETNPFQPGSVAFRDISPDRCSTVQPIATPDGVLFVGEGERRLAAIVGTGQTARPYIVRDASEFHAHLFTAIKALAVRTGGAGLPETYVFALNTDGTAAVGRYNPGKEWVGWVPWNSGGSGTFHWISALGSTVLFTVAYTFGSATKLVETLDPTAYLDAQCAFNAAPAALAPGPGQGALWFMAGGTVHVMNGRRYLGTRAIDASGNIVLAEGDDLSAAALVSGLKFEPTFEPFIPHAAEGQSVKQTHRRRRVPRMAIAYQNCTGFTFAGKRLPPFLQGELAEGEPSLREGVLLVRPLGRDYDPRYELVKDTPGPVRIVEFSAEVSV